MGYDKAFIAGLQFMWGKGFLSPGGPEEVRAVLRGHDLAGKSVLDIGSGLGGIDLLLLRELRAAHVIGIDVDVDLVAASAELAAAEGLADRAEFRVVVPGPLPFAAKSFDVVFSKDAMVHIADKRSAYAEMFRVLKPGGWFLASDWLWSAGAATSPAVKAWLPNNSLGFAFTTPAEAKQALQAAGFAEISITDRNAALQASNRELIRRLEGRDLSRLVAAVGEASARDRLDGAHARQGALDSRDLLPTHLKGRRPG